MFSTDPVFGSLPAVNHQPLAHNVTPTMPFDKILGKRSFRFAGFAWRHFTDDKEPVSELDFTVPMWAITLATAAPFAWWVWRKRTAFPPGACPKCGYDLRASPERCPECGAVVAQRSI